MMPIEISIIIPLYNKEEFIKRTLKSVALQDINNWECIIVDDGSTDSSVKIVNDFIKMHPGNWKLITQKNSGQTSARNHGVRVSQGRYLSFLDADDLWSTNKLRLQFTALESSPNACLVLSAFAIFKNNIDIPRVVRHRQSKKMNRRWLLMSGFGGGLESVGMVRRNSQLLGEMFDSALSTSSGLDLSLRLAEIGPIILLPQIGLYYRINSGQWHANTNELNKNLTILSKRYQGKFRQNLIKNHNAYLFWISARGFGRKSLIFAMLRALLNLGNRRLLLLLSLISRNIASTLRGRLLKNQTLPALRLLNH